MNATNTSRWIGQEVRSKRTTLGITQAQLAEASGVSERLIRSLEQGEAPGIGLDRLTSVLTVLGIELTLSGRTRPAVPDIRDDEYSKLLESAVASWTKEAAHES